MTEDNQILMLEIISHSSAQTQQFGMRLGELLRGGELLLLDGQLGMGKTTFTQGLAQGMGIATSITSPTFTLLKEYAVQPSSKQEKPGTALYHFDLYRLDDSEELFTLGFEDYFYETGGVCVVEWADKAEGFWVPEHLQISMTLYNTTERRLAFTAIGEHYVELLQQFQKNIHVITRV